MNVNKIKEDLAKRTEEALAAYGSVSDEDLKVHIMMYQVRYETIKQMFRLITPSLVIIMIFYGIASSFNWDNDSLFLYPAGLGLLICLMAILLYFRSRRVIRTIMLIKFDMIRRGLPVD